MEERPLDLYPDNSLAPGVITGPYYPGGSGIVFFEGWVDGVDGVSELGWELGWGSDDGWMDTWVHGYIDRWDGTKYKKKEEGTHRLLLKYQSAI